jgi:Cu/Ag efflux pump CusA
MVMTSSSLYGSPAPQPKQPDVNDTPLDMETYTQYVDNQLNPIPKTQEKIKSDGGSTKYYELPPNPKEFKNMNFALANIFKACYRFGEKDGAEKLYDINKMIYFAERLKLMLEKGQI